MDIRSKERWDGRSTVPTTVRMTAVMFLDADGMIAKDCMKIGGFIPVFLERIPTMRADMHFMVNLAIPRSLLRGYRLKGRV